MSSRIARPANSSIMTSMAEKKRRTRGAGRLWRRGNVWYIKYYVDGKPERESTHSKNRADAERLLKVRLGEVAAARHTLVPGRGVTIRDLIGLVISDYKLSKLRSLQDVEWRAEKHLYPTFGSLRACDLTTRHIEKYVQTRRSCEAADSTINRELAIVRRGFSLAMQNVPPLVSSAPFIRKLSESDNVRQGFLEDDQYCALRGALPDHLKCLCVFGYHLGMRLGELQKLRWDQIDWKAGLIKLGGRITKNKQPRTAPIYGEMRQWLEFQRHRHSETYPDNPHVFFYQNRVVGDHLKGWAEACNTAKISAILFHDLRRTAVRNMERAGFPRSVAKAISGHKTDSVYNRYDIVSTQDINLAKQRMEDYLKSLRTGPKTGEKGPSDGQGSAVGVQVLGIQ